MSTTDEASPERLRVFGLVCAASWLLYLHRYAWGVIKPEFRKDNPHLTDTEIGWLDSAFNLTYALGQVPSGLAGDIFGPRAILAVLTLLWSVSLVGLALVAGFWGFYLVRAAFGLTQAGAYPVLSKVTLEWFPPQSRTSVQGTVTAAGRVGAACSPVIVATLLMGLVGLSWQGALLVVALPGAVLAGGVWLVLRSRPQPAARPVSSRPAVRFNRAAFLSLGMLLIYAFASTFQDQLYVNWIPTFLREGRNLDVATMGLFAPLPFLGGALGGILGGILNDVLIRRTGNRRWSRAGIAFTGKFVAAGLVVVAVRVEDGRLAMVVLLLARLFGDWSLATQWGAITDMGGRASATLFGLVNTLGAAGGFVAGPVLGALKQHYGWDGLFLGAAAMCLLAAATWLFIDCTRAVVEESAN